MSREQIVRDTAYAIWEAEGKPEGRDAEHWKQAEARVSASLKNAGANGGAKTVEAKNSNAAAKSKAPAKGKTTSAPVKSLAATAPAKAGASKAAPSKKA